MRKIIFVVSISFFGNLYSQSEPLNYDNLPFISQGFQFITQFYLEDNEFHYQYSFEENRQIIVNKNTFTYKKEIGDNPDKQEFLECNIILDKSYQILKNNTLAYVSLLLDDCFNTTLTDFKHSIKIHIINYDGKKYFVVDSPAINGQYRQLHHNLSPEIIKSIYESGKLFIEP